MVDPGSETDPRPTRLAYPPPNSGTVGDLASWRALIEDEDHRCHELGLLAAVVSVDVGVNTLERLQRVESILLVHLRKTDRICRLSDHEIGVLLIPLTEIKDAEHWSAEIDRALRDSGMLCDIGFALRREDGLLAAAARADAAAATSRHHHDVLDLR